MVYGINGRMKIEQFLVDICEKDTHTNTVLTLRDIFRKIQQTALLGGTNHETEL